jgi:putative ABC transport system permease protein
VNDPLDKEHKPPQWALRFLKMICPAHLYEEIEGDLIQSYERDIKRTGEKKAKRRFVWNALLFFRTGILMRNKYSIDLNPFHMFRHFLKVFYRTSLKSGVYSIVNITGLAVGLSCSIFILLWIIDEVTFDHFHTDKEKIFRIMVNSTYADGNIFTFPGSTPGPMPDALKELPEIEEVCPVWNDRALFYSEDRSIFEEGVYSTSVIFKLFTFPIVEGDQINPISDNNAVAISQKMATKYFGGESAIGKIFRIDDKLDVKVTAVFQDIPGNSSLKFDFVLPFEIHAREVPWRNEWGGFDAPAYVKLHDKNSRETVDRKIFNLFTKPKVWPSWGSNVNFFLYPFSDLHLYGDFENGKQNGGRITYIRIFGMVGIFILVIACINFMNMATARSVSRSKEVGVRKVVGAGRQSIINQFMGESMLTAFISLSAALLMVQLFLPVFNDLTEKKLRIDYADSILAASLLGITLFAGLLAGSYPAIFLSSLKAVHVLKGKFSGLTGAGVRKALIVFQFSLSVILIFCALVIYQQIGFMRDKNLGFDRANLFSINNTAGLRKNFEAFRNEMLQNRAIRSVSQADANPMQIFTDVELAEGAWPGKEKGNDIAFKRLQCDYDLLPSLGFTFVAGRNFSHEFPADSNNFIITEEAARQMQLSDPVGQSLKVDRAGQIIGVVKDFHSVGLNFPMQPVIIALRPEKTDRIFIGYEPGQIQEVIRDVQQIVKKYERDFPMEYTFMDDVFERQYKSEIMTGKLSICFTSMAIFISCLGLFGLASFMAERRSKEISVRKVLGATASQVVVMLCKDFVLLVFIALIIALPVAWLGMQEFLKMYAYHVDLNAGVFAITAMSLVIVALITVSFQSIRAAFANPAKNLRSE